MAMTRVPMTEMVSIFTCSYMVTTALQNQMHE
jgi:hypothetical protein